MLILIIDIFILMIKNIYIHLLFDESIENNIYVETLSLFDELK